MSRKNDGINETILGWFKRVHPEELWAVKGMPSAVTFKDMEKSMAAGQGMGEAEHHSDTATRELMLDRLAELLDKDVNELIDWCNANFRERVRREYKAKHPKAKKPDIKKLRDLRAADVRIATLFFKPNSFQYDYPIDYKGMDIGNDFIVGYGLDYDQQGRNLPDIYKIIE